MEIVLSPIRAEGGRGTVSTVLHRRGEVLEVNGVALDFSALPEGGTLVVDSPLVVGEVTRAGGRVRLTVLLPHGADAPEAVRFPAPIVDPPDGPVLLPGGGMDGRGGGAPA